MPRRPGDRRPEKADQPWSTQESDLKTYAAAGLTAQEMAQLLGRTIGAVKKHAQRIGLPLPANTRRPIKRKHHRTE